MANRDIDIRVTGTDEGGTEVIKKTGDAIDGVGDKAKKADDALSKAGKNSGLKQVGADAESSADKSSGLASKLSNVNEKLENIQKSAHGMSALFDVGAIGEFGRQLGEIGNKALEAGEHYSQVAMNAQAADASLNAMMEKRGDGGKFEEISEWAEKLAYDSAQVSDVPIKRAAAGLEGFGVNAEQVKDIMPGLIGQARLYGQSIDTVAMSLGRAMASGNVGQLRRIGIVISQDDMDRIGKMTNELEKQKAIFEVTQVALKKFALGATEGLGDAEIAANRAELAMETFETRTGAGAAWVGGVWDGFKTKVIGVAGAFPIVDEAIGGTMVVVGGLAHTFGETVSMIANVARGYMGLQGYLDHRNDSLKAAAALTDENTISTKANTIAEGENAEVQGEGAIATDVHSGAQVVATGTTGALTIATGLLDLALSPIIIILAALTAAYYGFRDAMIGSADASKMSNKELEYKWGILGKLWVMLSQIGNSKPVRIAVDLISGNWKQALNDVGTSDNSQNKALYDQYAKQQKKNGKAVPTFDQWNANNGTASDAASGDTEAAAKASIDAQNAPPADPAMAKIQAESDAMMAKLQTQMSSPPSMSAAPSGDAASPKAAASEAKAEAKQAAAEQKATDKLAATSFKDGIKEQKAELKTKHDQRMAELKEERQVQSLNNKIAALEAKVLGEHGDKRIKDYAKILDLTRQRDATAKYAASIGTSGEIDALREKSLGEGGAQGGRDNKRLADLEMQRQHSSLIGTAMNATAIPYNWSTNPDSRVDERGSVGRQQITINPKTQVTRANDGGFDIAILPETIHIPNDYHASVRGL